MHKPREYYSEILHSHMLDKGQISLFIYLTWLSAMAFAKPKSDMSNESKAHSNIPAIENRAKYTARRLALLNAVQDDDEMRFLDYWARWDTDLLQAIDDNIVPFGYAKSALRSALNDIMVWQKSKRSA